MNNKTLGHIVYSFKLPWWWDFSETLIYQVSCFLISLWVVIFLCLWPWLLWSRKKNKEHAIIWPRIQTRWLPLSYLSSYHAWLPFTQVFYMFIILLGSLKWCCWATQGNSAPSIWLWQTRIKYLMSLLVGLHKNGFQRLKSSSRDTHACWLLALGRNSWWIFKKEWILLWVKGWGKWKYLPE